MIGKVKAHDAGRHSRIHRNHEAIWLYEPPGGRERQGRAGLTGGGSRITSQPSRQQRALGKLLKPFGVGSSETKQVGETDEIKEVLTW